MSRMLAAKSAIACRVDALGEDVSSELGTEHRAKLEMRIIQLQEQGVSAFFQFLVADGKKSAFFI